MAELNSIDKFLGEENKKKEVENSKVSDFQPIVHEFSSHVINNIFVHKSGVITPAQTARDIISAEWIRTEVGKTRNTYTFITEIINFIRAAIREKYPDVVITGHKWHNVDVVEGYKIPETTTGIVTTVMTETKAETVIKEGLELSSGLKIDVPVIDDEFIIKGGGDPNYEKSMASASVVGQVLFELERHFGVYFHKAKLVINIGKSSFETKLKHENGNDSFTIKMSDTNEAKKHKKVVESDNEETGSGKKHKKKHKVSEETKQKVAELYRHESELAAKQVETTVSDNTIKSI